MNIFLLKKNNLLNCFLFSAVREYLLSCVAKVVYTAGPIEPSISSILELLNPGPGHWTWQRWTLGQDFCKTKLLKSGSRVQCFRVLRSIPRVQQFQNALLAATLKFIVSHGRAGRILLDFVRK